MRKFLCCRDNFAEKQAWQKYCWVNIEMPTEEDTLYLTRDLKIPSAFLSDIRDVDALSLPNKLKQYSNLIIVYYEKYH